MGDLEQALPKSEDIQHQVHNPIEEVNLDTVKEPKIAFVTYALLT